MTELEKDLLDDESGRITFDFQGFLFKLLRNWLFIAICVGIAISIAYYINVRKQNIYRLNALISVETKQNPFFTANTSISFNWGGVSGKIGKIMTIFGLLFMVLILPFIFIGNSIGNKGPLFYTQERIGRNSSLFTIYKFRAMVVTAEEKGAKWATKNDDRVTTFGKFLRRSRLDEIPQFINVFKGEMSIIGPRPELPFFVAELSRSIPFYETRHIIKPGQQVGHKLKHDMVDQ